MCTVCAPVSAGALSLKKTHLEPRLVLTLALEPSVQEQRLRDMNLGFRDAAMRWAVQRTRAHLDWHQAHAGFFDALFATDDIVGAYLRLQQLVSDYLGLGGQSETTAERASRSRDDEPEPEPEAAKAVLNTPSEQSPQQVLELELVHLDLDEHLLCRYSACTTEYT